MWPCRTCGEYATSREGCVEHAPERPEQSFEEELLEGLLKPVGDDFHEGAVMISGMRGDQL